ncbi:MAG TPA: phosphatase PAP2 family protein [Syntrophales bacterium]|nr:phosphatase PAP2 family protein [Syntrophales bacterium]
MSMRIAGIITLDRKLNSKLAVFRKPWLMTIMAVITQLGSGPFWVVAYTCIFAFAPMALMPLLIAAIEAELATLVIILTLRYLIRRERPHPGLGDRPLDPWNRYSFPSHHSARMIMLSVVCGAHYQASLAVMLPVAGLIGFSRLYLEKHYLSDVLTGAAVGGLVAAAALYLNT